MMRLAEPAALLAAVAGAAALVKVVCTGWLLRQRQAGRKAPMDEALWYAGKLSALLLLAAWTARAWLLEDRPTFLGLALLSVLVTPLALVMTRRRWKTGPKLPRRGP
jgi:hypothetical protein